MKNNLGVMPSSFKIKAKKRRNVISTRKDNAGQTIGDIGKNESIYGFTAGQFCAINIIEHILDNTGPADVKIVTWTAAVGDLQAANDFLNDGRIRDIKFVVDRSFVARQPEYCDAMLSLFPGSIRSTRIHAKMMLITNDEWNIVIHTSMNLNHNRRFENFEIHEDADLSCFHQSIFADLWNASEEVEVGKKTNDLAKSYGGTKFALEQHEFNL